MSRRHLALYLKSYKGMLSCGWLVSVKQPQLRLQLLPPQHCETACSIFVAIANKQIASLQSQSRHQ